MNVYHNGNLWSQSKRGQKLTPVSLQETVLWGDQELFLPAVYVGTAGAILDICAKIPVEKMTEFLKNGIRNAGFLSKPRKSWSSLMLKIPEAGISLSICLWTISRSCFVPAAV